MLIPGPLGGRDATDKSGPFLPLWSHVFSIGKDKVNNAPLVKTGSMKKYNNNKYYHSNTTKI